MNKDTIKEFSQAYNDIGPNILKHIYFRVSDWESAQDLTQEAFFKTWQYINDEKKKVRDFKKFIYMVANNLIIDHYRQKDKRPVSIENISIKKTLIPSTQEKEVDSTIQMEMFKKCLLELKPSYREIITYRYVSQLSIKEISKITGRSANNISVIIHRGLKILKKKSIESGQKFEE